MGNGLYVESAAQIKMDRNFSIVGLGINLLNLDEVKHFLINYDYKKPGYICLPDSHVINLAYKNKKLRDIINQSTLTLPDGKPIEIYAKANGHKNATTVSGYWLCKKLLNTNLTHFFYGSTDIHLSNLKNKILEEFPNSNVLGFKSPPILNINEIENNQEIISDIKTISKLKPNIIWVGLSSPKQEYLMHLCKPFVENSLMIGIGGVFDYLSEYRKISPEWLKMIGLRWLYRLIKEPRRLFKRELSTVIKTPFLLIKDYLTKI